MYTPFGTGANMHRTLRCVHCNLLVAPEDAQCPHCRQAITDEQRAQMQARRARERPLYLAAIVLGLLAAGALIAFMLAIRPG